VGLNIKNQEAETKIRELAALRGVSLVAAVLQATQNELEREKAKLANISQPAPRKRSELFQEFAREYARRSTNPIHSWDVDSLLYDEKGLPR
jgi:hypothetical protein